ncbi:TolC family protein [Archangium gephyra]|uniref:TolC family protein n=1 Tax=Archangium gephyra TaxID=48 RepID=UPI003B760A3C
MHQAKAPVQAARERVPQASALPDPVLQVGIQNDGFNGLMIGEMEGSYFSIMVSQSLPFPGKRALRTEVARLGATAASAQLARTRLSIEAEVRRGYLDLLLTRERLMLLERLQALWKQSAEMARIRYETGEGAQSDLLRAQLEAQPAAPASDLPARRGARPGAYPQPAERPAPGDAPAHDHARARPGRARARRPRSRGEGRARAQPRAVPATRAGDAGRAAGGAGAPGAPARLHRERRGDAARR